MKIPPVYLATAAMLFQQALSTMGGLTIPFLAPPIAAETGLSASLVGLYVPMLYAGSMLSSLAGGGFMLRYGALRVSQACLAVVAAGLLINAGGALWLFVLGALVIGMGGGPSTPASSHILARYATPDKAPLIFSIKQTGVPVAGMLAGILLPLYVDWIGWRGAIAAAAAMIFAYALLLQPLRAEFDSDRQPDRPLRAVDIRSTLTAVLRDPRIRELALSIFAFTGLQLAFLSFFSAFLSLGLGWSLAEAGVAYTVAMVAGVGGRIFWGWVGTRYVRALVLLGWLGLAMGAATIALGFVGPGWPVSAVWAVAFVFGLTGVGYQGVLLAEVARIAPPGMAGVVTGGTVFFAFVGMILFPAGFGLLLSLTGTYGAGFAVAGAPALLAGAMLLRSVRRRARAAA